MLGLDWPYRRHTDIFEGTQRYAAQHGWHCDIDEFVDRTLSKCSRKTVPYDGVIARATQAVAAQTARLKLPIVNVWASTPAKGLATVIPNVEAMGRIRAEHLLDRGFSRFACLVRMNDPSGSLEAQAFVARLAEAGFRCPVTAVPSAAKAVERSRRSYEITAHWVDSLKPTTGVYVYDEHAARQVIQICRNRGWSVPHDIAIIAGDNERTLCSHPAPGLTSIEVGFDRIGYEAARLLDQLMDGGSRPTRPLVLPPIGLVARASTDFFAVDDPLIAEALRYISSHLREPIGVDDIAAAVDTSRRTLENRFRSEMGITVAAEVRRLRIEMAKRLLTESGEPIRLIARETGFRTSKQLSEVFRRELDTTPRAFRKQMKVERAV